MKPVSLAICTGETLPRARATAAAPPPALAPGAVWSLKFGDDTVYCGTGKPWGEFKERASRAQIALREHAEEVDRERLHVVIQKGRLFQREHPEVPVLVDKGRFLLAELEPGRAREIGKGDVPCFSVQPVAALRATTGRGRQRVVFEAARAEPVPPNPVIQQVVSRISRQTYKAD